MVWGEKGEQRLGFKPRFEAEELLCKGRGVHVSVWEGWINLPVKCSRGWAGRQQLANSAVSTACDGRWRRLG